MPRSATGELRRLASGFAARVTIEGRERHDFPLPTCACEAAAKERTAALAGVALRLRRAGHADKGRKLGAMGAGISGSKAMHSLSFQWWIDTARLGLVSSIHALPALHSRRHHRGFPRL